MIQPKFRVKYDIEIYYDGPEFTGKDKDIHVATQNAIEQKIENFISELEFISVMCKKIIA